MRSKALPLAIAATLFAGSVATAFADDGEIFRRQTSSPPGEVMDPEPEGEHAFIKLMNFRVPAQSADGTLLDTLEYVTYDGDVPLTTTDAKPLINVFVYGPVIGFEDFSQSGFPGHGKREAYAAVSLDDGATWKRTNLSNSATATSGLFQLTDPVPDPADPACHHAPEPEPAVASAGGSSLLLVDDDDDDADCVPGVPVITEAEWDDLNQNFGRLEVEGECADPRARIEIVDACDEETVLFTVRADRDGEFEAERNVRIEDAPYEVIARVDDTDSDPVLVEDSPAEPCVDECTQLTEYPGDVWNIFHAVASNKVMVAWHSKYCTSGFPGYSGGTTDADTIATYLGIDNTVDLYLTDLFGVAGNQQSVDYKLQEAFPGEYDGVGEVPYGCLWSARGVLRENPEALGTTEVVWFQAERLTSGRRDVNRVEVSCTAGGGCGITWQEDPEGLRPGEGEGAGTGWAGATVNSQTDIWFSFIEWEDFDIVDNNGTFEPLADTTLTELGTGRPQPAVPMAIPVRLTNNARCSFPVNPIDESYCNEDFAGPYGIKDQCVDSVDIPLGPQGNLQPICIVDADDSGTLSSADLPNVANTGASRPRLNLQPRDTDGDGVTDDAWVVIIHEESKGLGRFPYLNDEPYANETTFGTRCEDETLVNCERDIGKNQWYISFALGGPDTSSALGDDFGLVNNLVAQQNQTNAPEVNWITGTFYPPMNTDDMWDFSAAGISYSIFNTEIARRAALMSQSLGKATTNATTGLMAMPLFKEGVINQGGPADIMARRIVLPDDFAGEATANPYAFENLACQWYDGEGNATDGTWLYTDGSNPYYPKGLCTAPTINLSNRTPHLCEASGGSDGLCPGAADMTCTDDAAFGQLCLSLTDPEDNQLLDKLLSWYECPGWNGADVSNGGNTGASTIPGACGSEPDSQVLGANLDDRSWYMPIDISKAHRGFLDGDYAFMLYAWSPNWKLNAVGRDRYELYTRRSFDGGVSWSTTPANFTASDGVNYSLGDGTTTCETWRDGADSTTDSHICTAYAADVPEQSRNVTQHISMRITTLDPRYTPTIASMPTDGDLDWAIYVPLDPTDIRRPDRNFVVFETGDNTTVAVGEAEPLNLDYGRAINFGDDYTVWAEETDLTVCYPNDPHLDVTNPLDPAPWAEGTGFCNEFDPLEGFPLALSEEASITSSAAGDFLYGTWGQFNVDEFGEFIDGDVMFRRVWFLDDYIPTNAWTKGNQ